MAIAAPFGAFSMHEKALGRNSPRLAIRLYCLPLGLSALGLLNSTRQANGRFLVTKPLLLRSFAHSSTMRCVRVCVCIGTIAIAFVP